LWREVCVNSRMKLNLSKRLGAPKSARLVGHPDWTIDAVRLRTTSGKAEDLKTMPLRLD